MDPLLIAWLVACFLIGCALRFKGAHWLLSWFVAAGIVAGPGVVNYIFPDPENGQWNGLILIASIALGSTIGALGVLGGHLLRARRDAKRA